MLIIHFCVRKSRRKIEKGKVFLNIWKEKTERLQIARESFVHSDERNEACAGEAAVLY